MFTLGKLAQVVHVTSDLSGADAFYRSVFGAECYYEGYSEFEKRDASLFAIGDFTIEPMAPAAEPGAELLPVGRFLHRFGDHLHSIAINVKGVKELYDHLVDHGIRVVGPGGSDPTQLPDVGVQSIYTHPKDTHCLLEFVDFGPELMEGSPRLRPDWDPGYWSDQHGLGITGPSHVTVVVHDIERATKLFVEVLGCPVVHEGATTGAGAVSRFVMLGNETIVELTQPVEGDTRIAHDLGSNGEMLHSVSLNVKDVGAAATYLTDHGVGADRTTNALTIDPASSFGAVINLTEATVPNDPR